MKFLRQGIALAVAGAGLAVIPAVQMQAQAAEPSLVQQMKNQAQGSVDISKESATGEVGFVRLDGQGDLMPSVKGSSASAAADKADAYLGKYAANFGARPSELKQGPVEKSSAGWTVTYTQEFQGVPVFGSMLRANLDEQGDLTAVNGYAAPDLALDTNPARSASAAAKVAVGAVKAMPPGADGKADTSGVKAVTNDLVIYRMGSTKGETGKAVLAYVVEVSNGANIRDMVFVDANSGKLINRYSMIHDALERHLLEAAGSDDPTTFTNVWNEGDPFPGSLNVDQQNEIIGTGEAYWFFKNVFGRDSYDGAGHSMTTVNNDGRIDCPNANWNGITTNYCDGVTADDVVAHEWGHAYTEKTHGLIYQWQSGALNESYSDIWGETVDLINGRMDADENLTKRADGECSQHSPALPQLVINSPASIAKICPAGAAAYGPQVTAAGLTGNVVLAVDAANPAGPITTDACTPLTNAAAVAGKIALADRGTCSFKTKTLNIQQAGGIGAVIGNNTGVAPFGLADDPLITTPITIPSVGISLPDRSRISSALTAGATVNVTMKDATTTAKSPSHRWLVGEDAPAFNPTNPSQAAIRDMWMPTCHGDPGKVSDAEYFCDTSDAGGVHSNSGVPNHGYALLVDGGSYNGVTVTGIGMDKAAAIYYRAMTAYQTPTTDFVDHADALTAACNDMVGQPINTLTVAANATPTPATPVAAADCAQVANAIAAVELRKEPTQCNFQPLFEQGGAPACGDGFAEDVLWSEDFENGLAGWGKDQEIVYDGGLAREWTTVTDAEGHSSRVAFGNADGRIGQCVGGPGDFSSRDSIIAPVIELPAGTLRAPRLSFEHSIATELNVDGGNVKVSINGGGFETVPASAYTLNAPDVLLPAAAGNTNPMAGEEAFTGTDGGTNTTVWGTSVIDLTALGIEGGDTVQFRLDIGREGCGGVSGWWVDNIKLMQCKLKAKVSGVHLPEPSTFGQASSVKVTVERDGSMGSAPTGDVTLTKADGSTVGSGTLAGGTTTIPLPADLPVGVHTMTASYSGSEAMAPATGKVTVTVSPGSGRDDSKTRLKIFPKKPVFKDDIKAAAKVRTIDGAKVTGRVKFLLDGKKIGSRVLDNGKAELMITRTLKIGKHRLVAVYTGSNAADGSRDKVKFKVRRR
ncbi:M4 family metallopeptidase [Nocardioides sp. LHG3406-4]|uniref:M4 family metallopeptidase n=1 Tax=Nocardioides sp. LHG3406-4 TaxID=2804575 RepID=UPI003CF72AE6